MRIVISIQFGRVKIPKGGKSPFPPPVMCLIPILSLIPSPQSHTCTIYLASCYSSCSSSLSLCHPYLSTHGMSPGNEATLQSQWTYCMRMLHTYTHTHTLMLNYTEKSKISTRATTQVSPSDEAKKASRELKNLAIDMACKSVMFFRFLVVMAYLILPGP